MSKKRTIFCLIIFTLAKSAMAADACAPLGWCTQGSGTTGAGAASAVTVSSLADLQSAVSGTTPRWVFVQGSMGAGVGTRVAVGSNKTIFGLPGATLVGGFDIKNASNVILRNMRIQGPGAVDVDGVDCVSIDNSSNVWLDHLEIWDGQDGNLDIVNGSNYICVTWTKFRYSSASTNHQFCNLLGNSDSKTTDRGKIKVTFHKNWWAEGVKERMPRVRFGQVHIANNLFSSAGNGHCVRAGIEADLLVESNVFRDVRLPIDLYENNFTAVTARNNLLINATGNSAGSGNAFTPPYMLALDATTSLESEIRAGAGASLSSPYCSLSLPSPLPSPSRSATRSATPLPSPSPTPSRSATASPSLTRSFTASASRSASPSRTVTQSATVTPTQYSSSTASPSRTASPWPSPTQSATAQATASSTAQATASSTAQATASSTAQATASSTFTSLPTFSATPSLSSTQHASPSQSATPLASSTRSPSPSQSRTPTLQASASPTLASSLSPSPTSMSSSTASPTSSPVLTQAINPDARITAAMGYPSLGPTTLLFNSTGPINEGVLRIYSSGMTLVAEIKSGPWPAGWSKMSLRDLGNLHGTYFFKIAPRANADPKSGRSGVLWFGPK